MNTYLFKTKHPSKNLYVIGITGTNGKTTISYLIGEVLKTAGFNTFVLGTLNSGDRNLSTPEAKDTARIMQDHLNQGGTHFVMEVTSEGIDQSRVSDIDFNIKILSNITQDHLDYHKTFEHYKRTKLDFMANGVNHKVYPTDFLKESIKFSTKLLGKFNLLNIKAAAAALRYMNIDEYYIQSTLSHCSPPKGRLEYIESGQLYMVIIDYAHTPDALQNILSTVKALAIKRKGKLYVLFGCGGDRDSSKRPKMGLIASQFSDFLVITDDNPRTEPSKTIIEDIASGIPKHFKNYVKIPDRRVAITTLIQNATKNDIVILLGKGHETYQVLKDEIIHFDDREEANKAILLRLKNDSYLID